MDRREFLATAAFDVFGTAAVEQAVERFDLFGDAVAVAEKAKPVGVVESYVWERGCAACERFKRDIQGYDGLRFDIKTTTKTAPWFRWKIVHKTGWEINEYVGWPGLRKFVDIYNASISRHKQEPVQYAAAEIYYNPRRHGSHWSFPGGLRLHLCNAHGYCNTANWSESRLLRTHDWAHGG